MRAVVVLSAALIAAAAPAQTVIDSHGIRANGVRIDGTGVHTGAGSVDRGGVHAAGAGRGVTIVTNGNKRAVDCGGRGLTINGNGNLLTVANCRTVVVGGNGNLLSVRYDAPGRLSVIGNRNQVSWRASRRIAVSVSNAGTRNRVARADG